MAEDFLKLSAGDRRDALGVAARASGRAAHILEKDVMVVWALDAVTSSAFGGDIVFKGGTSLSKIYGAIRRFSEDLDLTYDVRAFAKDLVDEEGHPKAQSKSQMRRWSEEIKARLEGWTKEVALPVIRERAASAGLDATIEANKDKIVIAYEPIFLGTGYLPPRIILEFGARSTGEPNDLRQVSSAHSDDCDHRFRRIATTCSDRSRPVWRGRLQRRWMLMVMSVFRGLVKHGKSRPGSQQEGPARDAERPYG